MKTFSTIVSALTISASVSAQCLVIDCNPNISVNTTPGNCNAVVTYSPASILSNTCPAPSITDTFQFTGAQQTFTVPAGVTSVQIETWGAQGGANWINNTNFGGYVAGTISVTPGEQLAVFVGGQATTTAGGFNGGGSGEGAGKGGGGGSDVRQGGITYNDRAICAGGGGGAGYWSNLHVVGGQGGGLIGGDGYRNTAADPGGKGGTQSGPGADGTCINFNVTACAGGFGFGGSITGCGCETYGGGGGWYGGAASGNCRGGGGGSGYAIGTATAVLMNTGVRTGNGMVVISYATSANITITQTAGLASAASYPVGQTTNTFFADDGAGNTATCSFTVTVTDNEAPVLAQPANISQSVDANSCGAMVTWSAPMATDNCTATVTITPSSGSFFPIGTTTVTVVATDGANNADTTTFTVTVTDTIAPVITGLPTGMTVSNDATMCNAAVTWSPAVVVDNCGGWTLTSNHNSGDAFPVGSTTVTYIVIDSSGLSDTVSFVITVNDTESPSIFSCASDMTVGVDAGMCTASNVMLGTPISIDNCSVVVTNDAPSVFAMGATVVTWTVIDPGGNTATCQQTITVVDNEAPLLGCPLDMMACAGMVSFLPPAATDNCSSATVAQVSGPVSGSTLAAGSYTIVFAATDSSGNADSCSFTLVVNANPVISTSNPSTVCVTDGSYILSATPAGGTWSGPGVTGNTFSPSTAGNGAQAVTYSVTNANGCSATSIDTITVAPCTGINENGAVTFAMFPNPANTTFTFTSEEHGTVVVMDALGNTVLTETIVATQTEIGVDGLATGVYTVRFTSTSGAISTGKLQVLR